MSAGAMSQRLYRVCQYTLILLKGKEPERAGKQIILSTELIGLYRAKLEQVVLPSSGVLLVLSILSTLVNNHLLFCSKDCGIRYFFFRSLLENRRFSVVMFRVLEMGSRMEEHMVSDK